MAPADGLPDLPAHDGPFLRLVVDTAVGDRALGAAERQWLVDLTVAVVATIAADLTPNFWRPNRQPAQDAMGTQWGRRSTRA